MSASRVSDGALDVAAAGNRFLLLDILHGAEPREPERLAAELDERYDGLLLLTRADAGADCRMILYNRDGSRPEACGNGLRCIGAVAAERGYALVADSSTRTVTIATDAGVRSVTVHRGPGRAVEASADMGVPRVVEEACELELDERATGTRSVQATVVDMGNPHCVVFVDDPERIPVERLGPALEHHARFPLRTNVEFCRIVDGVLAVRFWERGVGETRSCGTGAAACAVAAIRSGRLRSAVRVRTRGGMLRVAWDGGGVLHLSGPVDFVRLPAESALESRQP